MAVLSRDVSCGLALLSAVFALGSAQLESNAGLRVAKQASARNGVQDQNSAETGFGGGGGGGIENSKYFHYQHLPEHDKYEFGYRRGNDHHVKERYEKAVPHEGHFKTKVRWADHKGGHGEHYWDYNHAGHGGDGDGEGSDPIPSYTDSQNANSNNSPRVHQKRQSDLEADRREYSEALPDYKEPALTFKAPKTLPTYKAPQPPSSSSDDATSFLKSFEDEIGGVESFEIHREGVKQKRTPAEPKKPNQESLKRAQKAGQEIQQAKAPQLFFDLETGKVIDESTGKTYLLQAVEN